MFQNEFECQKPTNDTLCLNTARSIWNGFTFADSPTWFWLHSLKPTNVEASHPVVCWVSGDDENFARSAAIEKGHWDYNPQNVNAII